MRVWGEAQPFSCAFTIAYTRITRPEVTVIAPAMSKALCARTSFDSGTYRSAATKTAIPTGMLTKKIHGHENASTRIPPSRSPTAAPPTAIAAQTLIALLRAGPSSKVVVMIESAAGAISAPPRPWRPRAMMRNSELGASPFNSEATVKITTPTRKIFFLPMRSPARPPSSRKPPKTSVYEFTIHCRSASDISRSSWIDGSATFTIVASRMTMNCAMQTSTSTSHGLTPWPRETALECGAACSPISRAP